MRDILTLLFRCRHARTSFPRSPIRGRERRNRDGDAETYIVCLDCGTQIPYSWTEMRPLRARKPRNAPGILRKMLGGSRSDALWETECRPES